MITFLILENLTGQPLEGIGVWTDPGTMVAMTDQNGVAVIDAQALIGNGTGTVYIFSYDRPYYVQEINLTRLALASQASQTGENITQTVYMTAPPEDNSTYYLQIKVLGRKSTAGTLRVYKIDQEKGDTLVYEQAGTAPFDASVAVNGSGMYKASFASNTSYDYDYLYANAIDPVLDTTLKPAEYDKGTVCPNFAVYDSTSKQSISSPAISVRAMDGEEEISDCMSAGAYLLHVSAEGYSGRYEERLVASNESISIALERPSALEVQCPSDFTVDGTTYQIISGLPRVLKLTSGGHTVVCGGEEKTVDLQPGKNELDFEPDSAGSSSVSGESFPGGQYGQYGLILAAVAIFAIAAIVFKNIYMHKDK